MIGFKSTLLNATLAITAALPLAAAGLFTSAGSAQAAALTGDLSLVGNGTATLFANSLTFNSPNTFAVSSDPNVTNGLFSAFTEGTINNILAFTPTSSAINPFIDLGTDAASISDNENIFTLTSATYQLTQSTIPNLVSINILTDGFFTSALGDISNGEGILTLQALGTVASLQNSLNGGQGISATYSGFYFATVPEPATVLGLGLVAAGMVMSRRRKSVVQ
jgi:hypothetical protein